MSSIKHVIIAAAGMGNRLGYGIPKSLVEVAGKKIIEYQLKLLKDIPYVRIVVGYMEDELIAYVKKIRNDVIFVRNPSFKDTLTLQSMFLGVKGLVEPCIIMDGDIIFEERSFKEFLNYCGDEINTIGISTSISEDPIYVDIINKDNYLEAVGFQTSPKTRFEWANIAYLNPSILENEKIHVYQQLQKRLPLRALCIDRLEIDTEEDLFKAEKVLKEKEYVNFK